MGLLHHPFWLQFVLAPCDISFQLFKLLYLAKDHWWGFSARNAHVVHIVIEIVILWVYYTTPFGFSLFWHFWYISFQLFNFSNYFVSLRITNEGSVPEMRIWSISLIKSYGIYNLVEVSFHIVKPGLYTDSKTIPCELFAKYMPKAQCYADPSFS